MQDFETLCFQDRADWLRLLSAYLQAEEAAAQAEAALAKAAAKTPVAAAVPADEISLASNPTEPEGEESATGWVARISHLDGVEAAQLSTLHGRVIALGYLKFKLIDRQVGLRYRLTPAGKQMAQSPSETRKAAA